ncbi:MAG: flagellar biosynthetic protein FliO [Pseudomonadales bacterium]|nr:flagellar biosynthetic protein FliO [Pseudomonadales bacterium]
MLAPCAAVLLPAAHAADRKFAAPSLEGATASGAGSLLEVTLSLAVVLAVVFAIAWLARRARALGGRGRRQIEVLDDLPLGVKERAVLIRVGRATLLIGVAPGHTQTLHTFAPDEAPDSAADGKSIGTDKSAPGVPGFAELLRRSLGR